MALKREGAEKGRALKRGEPWKKEGAEKGRVLRRGGGEMKGLRVRWRRKEREGEFARGKERRGRGV